MKTLILNNHQKPKQLSFSNDEEIQDKLRDELWQMRFTRGFGSIKEDNEDIYFMDWFYNLTDKIKELSIKEYRIEIYPTSIVFISKQINKRYDFVKEYVAPHEYGEVIIEDIHDDRFELAGQTGYFDDMYCWDDKDTNTYLDEEYCLFDAEELNALWDNEEEYRKMTETLPPCGVFLPGSFFSDKYTIVPLYYMKKITTLQHHREKKRFPQSVLETIDLR